MFSHLFKWKQGSLALEQSPGTVTATYRICSSSWRCRCRKNKAWDIGFFSAPVGDCTRELKISIRTYCTVCPTFTCAEITCVVPQVEFKSQILIGCAVACRYEINNYGHQPHAEPGSAWRSFHLRGISLLRVELLVDNGNTVSWIRLP